MHLRMFLCIRDLLTYLLTYLLGRRQREVPLRCCGGDRFRNYCWEISIQTVSIHVSISV